MFYFKNVLVLGVLVGLLVSCGHAGGYEEYVYDGEPIYCYQSLAGIECFKEPNHLDKRRMVNFYGPHPKHYDEPETLG